MPVTALPSRSHRWSLQAVAERGPVGNKQQPLASSRANGPVLQPDVWFNEGRLLIGAQGSAQELCAPTINPLQTRSFWFHFNLFLS